MGSEGWLGIESLSVGLFQGFECLRVFICRSKPICIYNIWLVWFYSLQHPSLKLCPHSIGAVQRRSQPSITVCLHFTHIDMKMLNDRIQSSSCLAPGGYRWPCCCSEGGITLCWAPKHLLISDYAKPGNSRSL